MIEGLLVCAVALGVIGILLQLFRAPPKTANHIGILQSADKAAERTERTLREELAKAREESANTARYGREELAHPIEQMRQTIDAKLTELQTTNTRHSDAIRAEAKNMTGAIREDLVLMLRTHGEHQDANLARMSVAVTDLTATTFERLERLREENSKHIELMRATVDEKLQGTLEKRLGESFKRVSDQLEQVYKGLGEMQTLATGVGDLRKVLTNVRIRGTWGEVQLRKLLEQVLAKAQYEENFSPKGGGERVEFAIRLPGRDLLDEPVWLPIDAKFPVEDYQRLVDAEERGDSDAMKAAGAALEVQIKSCAKAIRAKYIEPPKTTDFAILFLPVEGLFAEVVRRPGLVDDLQHNMRVVIAGPTTLWSILTSLQMGFRSLAIQQRSSEVWQLLSAVKAQWINYNELLQKVQKKLNETGNAVGNVVRSARFVRTKLDGIEAMPERTAAAVLQLDTLAPSDDAAADLD